jgi:aminoglycoside 6'-N-acetyltransferase I
VSNIRLLHNSDLSEWTRMRIALWPDCANERHELEMEEFFASPERYAVFVCTRPNGLLGGFAEFSIRDYVDGSQTKPVGYLEGWYVDPDLRGLGIGKSLVDAGEKWMRSLGLKEIGSDSELWNESAILAHRAIGFQETFRVVQFIKKL